MKPGKHIADHSVSRRSGLTRREWLRLSAAGALAGSMSGWLEALAGATAQSAPRRSCILLWMNGGPSQLDTFDLKPGHANGGLFREIDSAVPGMRISQHLPQLARHAGKLAIVRSMSTKEGDHSRATYLLRSGYLPQGPIRYPTLGSLVAKELGNPAAELPGFVSIAPYRLFSPAAYSPGFLGSQFDPLLVGDGTVAGSSSNDYDLQVEDLAAPADVTPRIVDSRLGLLDSLNDRFVARHASAAALGHRIAYERAVRLMRSAAGRAFDLDEEPDAVRHAYGRNQFGQGCLLARRLVERGVPFVEVTLGGVVDGQALGWDTHIDNFEQVRKLSTVLDRAWSTLLAELESSGLIEQTLIVWMGEFGRTPKINENGGRDHYPQAWSTVLAGGGIRGGQVIGRTSEDGTAVEERPVMVPDFLATVCKALGIDPMGQNLSNVGRPIRIVDVSAQPIVEALAGLNLGRTRDV